MGRPGIDEAEAQHRHWRHTQDGTAYRTWTFDFKSRVTQSLQQWMDKAGYEAGLLLRKPSDKADQWWYFLEHPQVPPDNNHSREELTVSSYQRQGERGFSLNEQVFSNRRLVECGANLSP